MIQTGFYEVSAEQEKDRYYAVYFTDEERGIIVNSLSETRELQNGVNTLLKKFKSEKKAEKWIEEQNREYTDILQCFLQRKLWFYNKE